MPKRRARAVLGLLSAALLVYYVLTPGGIFGAKAQGDGFFGFFYLPSLVVHRTLDLRAALPELADSLDTGRAGRKINRAPIGPALVMLPLYLAFEGGKAGVAAGLRALGRDPRILGHAPFRPHTGQMFYTGLCTALGAVLGLFWTFRLLARHLPEGAALVGAGSALLATPVFFYATIQPHYQHGLAFAAVALFLERWDRARGQARPGRFFALGLLGGVAMLMRVQEAVFLLAPGLELCWGLGACLRARPRRFREAAGLLGCGAALAGGAVVAFAPQVLVWAYYFGWFVRPFSIEPLRPGAPALLLTLYSMRAGLLPWTPVVYVAAAGLVLSLRRAAGARLRGLAAVALVVAAADVLLVSVSWIWYGAWGFGCRRLSDCAPLWAIGVGAAWQAAAGSRGRRIALGAVLFACVALNLTLVELTRRRVLPSAGDAAMPAWRWVERAGGPRWLRAALRLGNPLVQPVGLLFALRHRAPVTAWEAVAGNYALERETHDRSVLGDRWDFTAPEAADFVIEGLIPDMPADARGRPVQPRVRVLLQPFAREPIDAVLTGELPEGVGVRWDGEALPVLRSPDGTSVRFTVPAARVDAHRVGELTLELAPPAGAPPPRLRLLRLRSTTQWWR